jgi:hypothetical protein
MRYGGEKEGNVKIWEGMLPHSCPQGWPVRFSTSYGAPANIHVGWVRPRSAGRDNGLYQPKKKFGGVWVGWALRGPAGDALSTLHMSNRGKVPVEPGCHVNPGEKCIFQMLKNSEIK